MIKESESSKLEDAPGGSSLHISRRLKHLSLGMPKASPSSSTNYHVTSRKLYFYSVTSYVLYLERLYVLVFVLFE